MSEEVTVEIYTDGGCSLKAKTSKGSWGFVVVKSDNVVTQQSGKEVHTTSNRMEYFALIKALEYIQANNLKNVSIYSDSQLLTNTYNQWYDNWVKKNKLKGKLNLDLVQHFIKLKLELRESGSNVKLSWVKGHNGNKWNEHVDNMCSQLLRPSVKNNLKTPRVHTIRRPVSSLNRY